MFQGLLPPESFVAFAAKKLARPSCVFINSHVTAPCNWLEHYAFLVPSDLESDEDLLDERKTFFAERYGGRAIGHHGGGGRCGIAGEYQVKGIGCNPLIGEVTGERGFWHSHGGVSLVDAIQEAVWGEVFNYALPYGAVRVAALILTGTQCWVKSPLGERTTAARAIIVREAALRPAHFERTPYFRPRTTLLLSSDVARVRAAIEGLPNLLPTPDTYASDVNNLLKIDRVQHGLFEMARRFAVQCAASKSKRLMHGTLSDSNVCLDGRWIDFGTVSSLPHYANTKSFGLPPHVRPFWGEQRDLLPALKNLCFYVHKYLPGANNASLPSAKELAMFFLSEYRRALVQSFVRLAGFPEPLLAAHLSDPDVLVLGKLFIRVARHGVERGFSPGIVDLEAFGSNNLRPVLLLLARWHDHKECNSRVSETIDNPELCARVISAYRTVIASIHKEAEMHSVTHEALRRFCLLNVARATKDIPELYRHRMLESCGQLVRSTDQEALPQAIQSWIDDLTEQSSLVYSDTCAFRCLTWKRETLRIYFDAVLNAWRIEEGSGKVQYLPWKAVVSDTKLRPMRIYWGESFWRAFFPRLDVATAGYEHG
jgi:hypothetical protein